MENNNQYKQDDLLTFIRVRFPGNAKSHPFLLGKRKFMYGQRVLAMSDRGMTVGYVNSIPYEIKFHEGLLPIKAVSKIASPQDIEEQQNHFRQEKKSEQVCKSLIDKHKLDMTLTHVEIIHFGKKTVFYFNAPARVDFRELLKELVGELKTRIELRQISIRDRAAAVGAVGSCGLQTCCSSFLASYGNVTIKMAKNQNLALIPNKINGVCGQIKCCIKYEDNVYTEKRKKLPKEGSFIKTVGGINGKVTKLHLIKEQFELIDQNGIIRRFSIAQYDYKDCLPAAHWQFPKHFEHISNETSVLIP